MIRKLMASICTVCFLTFAFPAVLFAEKVGVFFDSKVPQISFAAGDIKTALESKGFIAEMLDLSKLKSGYSNKKVVIALASNNELTKLFAAEGGATPSGLGEQSYALRTTTKSQTSYWVLGGDVNGSMYGALQVAENITFEGFPGNYNETVSPNILERGAKLNMPLDRRLPTYSGKFNATSSKKAIPHVWDMKFWETWIDEQARNRFNILSVWVHHPFPALVKVPGYEKACLPNIEGFDGYVNNLNLEQRIAFWKQVMTYAHSRGFKFYFFCWNVCVDYAQDQYPEIERNEKSNTTVDYLGKCMTALLETYPELDGFGISAGDNMKLPKDERPEWTWRAYGKAAYEYALANPDRKFTILHRGLGTTLTNIYKDWGPLTKLNNFKFEYSIKYANAHMYSVLAPKWYEKEMIDASSAKQKTWLTLRNDDFFYLDLGNPKFVRDYIDSIPYRDVINSFYIGSDIYQPTRSYLYKDSTLNGQLEIQRNWYSQMLWGRIAYNRNISDDVFKKHMAKRFPQVSSENLFNAWALASRPLPKMQELTQASWQLDAHWYAESSHYPNDGGTYFRNISDLIEAEVSKGSQLCSVESSAAGTCGDKKTTFMLADEMEADAKAALSILNSLSGNGDTRSNIAINNIKQQAYLATHFAYKIRGATYKKARQKENAKEAMGKAYCWWMIYVNSMDSMYIGNRFRTVDLNPDWHFADKLQLKEYTDLGGVGTPDFKQLKIEQY
jgi:hypothetical protein